jgi:hypothetical protein
VKKGAPEKTAPAGKPAPDRPFGQGIETQRVTPRAVERRLYQILGPLLATRGGMVATLEEVGESGVHGLALTFEGGEAYDLIIQEARQ